MSRVAGFRRFVQFVVIAFLAGGGARSSAFGDDPPAPAPGGAPTPAPAPAPPMGAVAAAKAAAEARQRTSLLKDRVSEWCRARQDLKIDCPNCGGSGAVRVGRFLKQCTVCFGAGKSISKDRFLFVNYNLYSPDYRKLESAKPTAEALWLETRKDVKNFKNLGSYRLETHRVIGERHGFAVTFENGDSVPRETRWIYGMEPTSRKVTWFLWREEADGPWPDPSTAPGTSSSGGSSPSGSNGSSNDAPPTPQPEPEPVVRGLDEKVKTAILAACAAATMSHTVDKVSGDASVAIISLVRGRALLRLQWKAVVDADVIAAARAAFSVKGFDALHVVLTVPAKNSFGAIENRPRRAFDMTRETFAKIDFTNLSMAEAIRLFTLDLMTLGEWVGVEEDPPPDALSLSQDETVAKALAASRFTDRFPHKFSAFGRYSDVLMVKLSLKGAALDTIPDEDASEAAAAPAAVAGALAVLPSLKEWAGVRFEFALPYRDKFGKIEPHVHFVTYISRDTFSKLKIENLTSAEIFTHFELDRPVLKGLEYWRK